MESWPSGSFGEEANSKSSSRSLAGAATQDTKGKGPSDNLSYKDVSSRTRRQRVNNIKGAYQHADAETQRQGARWYQGAHVQAAQLANEVPYHVDRPMDRATAAIARLSPSGGGMDWNKNVPAAHEALHMSEDDADKVTRGNRAPVRNKTLRHASNQDIGKAWGVLHGDIEPESALTTQKIGHFYSNIRHPSGDIPQATQERHPEFWGKVNPKGSTVDGRADSIIKGHHVPWGTSIGMGVPARYEHATGLYEQAGKEIGVPAHNVQATTWTVGAQLKQNRKPGQKLDYIDYDAKQPVQKQPGSFGQTRMRHGMVPRSIMHPEGGALGAS